MTDIVTFLTARVAEDATEAEAATSGPWHVDQMPHRTNVVVPHEGLDRIGTAGQRMDVPIFTGQTANRGRLQWEADAAHIARHDPARVLREVAAKRQIFWHYAAAIAALEETRSAAARETPLAKAGHTITQQRYAAAMRHVEGLELALYAMAAPYADADGYDPAWRME